MSAAMPQQWITWSMHVPFSLLVLRYHLHQYGVKSTNKMSDVTRNPLALSRSKTNTTFFFFNYRTIPSYIYIQSLFLSTLAAAAIQFSLNHENLKSYSCLLASSPPSYSPPHFSL